MWNKIVRMPTTVKMAVVFLLIICTFLIVAIPQVFIPVFIVVAVIASIVRVGVYLLEGK